MQNEKPIIDVMKSSFR